MKVKSIACVDVKGRGSIISEVAREKRKVSTGKDSNELWINVDVGWEAEVGEADVSTSMVEAMLKDKRDVVSVGVMTITTAVVSSISCSTSIRLLLEVRDGVFLCTSISSTEEKANDDDIDIKFVVGDVRSLG